MGLFRRSRRPHLAGFAAGAAILARHEAHAGRRALKLVAWLLGGGLLTILLAAWVVAQVAPSRP